MGLPQKMPGRRKWQSLQQEQRSRSPVQQQALQPLNAMQQAAEAAAAGQAEAGSAGATVLEVAALSASGAASNSVGSGTTLPPLKPAAQT
jgi:hypothetical protein